MLNLEKFCEKIGEVKELSVDTSSLGYNLFSILQNAESLLDIDPDKFSYEEIDSCENGIDADFSKKMENAPKIIEKVSNLKVKKQLTFF